MLSNLVNQKRLFFASLFDNVTVARAENGVAWKCCRFYFYFYVNLSQFPFVVIKNWIIWNKINLQILYEHWEFEMLHLIYWNKLGIHTWISLWTRTRQFIIFFLNNSRSLFQLCFYARLNFVSIEFFCDVLTISSVYVCKSLRIDFVR